MTSQYRRNLQVPGLILPCLLLVAACGGGGGGDGGGAVSNVPPPTQAPPPVQTGVFKDLNVAGLAYSSGGESGVTNANGRFTCETGNTVAFSLGSVAIGETDCATLVTPLQMATDDAGFELEVANIARFLQMLDLNGDPGDGIEISVAVQQIADSWPVVDFETTDLANELVTIISDAASVDGTAHQLPTEQAALVHLYDTVSCAFAGAYAGSFMGSNSGAAALLIGYTSRNPGLQNFAYQWEGYDAVDEFTVFGGGSGTFGFDIRVLPFLDNFGTGAAGPIDVAFVTPDDVVGDWEGGDLTLSRIGADNGDPYRFIGIAAGDETTAYTSLNFDGTQLSGEAFDVISGTLFTVTGGVNGNAVSLSASGGGEVVNGSGTLTSDAEGNPRDIQGTLADGSTISLSACRLN